MSFEEFNHDWEKASPILLNKIGQGAFQSWIKPLGRYLKSPDTIVFTAPSRFIRDWVLTHYRDVLLNTWKEINSQIKVVEIELQGENSFSQQVPPNETISDQADISGEEEIEASLDARFTFDQFVVGKPNELAYAAARRVAESEAPPFNPLFLYGGVGLGKTHLMHAIAWHLQETRPRKKVAYLSAEKFMYEFIRSLRFKDTVSFKERFRNVDVLMIDDVQFICGKDSTQEEFFHTFNALVDHNRQVIISADKSPSDLEKIEDRLKSRLSCGLVADIHPTTYELRLGILHAKIAALAMPISKEVVEFLALRITSNVRELEGALNRLVAHAMLVGRPITLETTKEVLRDLLRSNERRITVDDIQRQVCDLFRIKLSELTSPNRQKNLVQARQIAIYLCKNLTTLSMPDIGRRFDRDHTTVLHAVRKVIDEIQKNPDMSKKIELLEHALRQS